MKLKVEIKLLHRIRTKFLATLFNKHQMLCQSGPPIRILSDQRGQECQDECMSAACCPTLRMLHSIATCMYLFTTPVTLNAFLKIMLQLHLSYLELPFNYFQVKLRQRRLQWHYHCVAKHCQLYSSRVNEKQPLSPTGLVETWYCLADYQWVCIWLVISGEWIYRQMLNLFLTSLSCFFALSAQVMD